MFLTNTGVTQSTNPDCLQSVHDRYQVHHSLTDWYELQRDTSRLCHDLILKFKRHAQTSRCQPGMPAEALVQAADLHSSMA
jgi:hypothetical protein